MNHVQDHSQHARWTRNTIRYHLRHTYSCSPLTSPCAVKLKLPLLYYGAGHRSCRAESLPLRRGMMHYAYGRQVPIQVVITANKEAVISEKHMSAHFGQTLLVGYSEVIDPKVTPGLCPCAIHFHSYFPTRFLIFFTLPSSTVM